MFSTCIYLAYYSPDSSCSTTFTLRTYYIYVNPFAQTTNKTSDKNTYLKSRSTGRNPESIYIYTVIPSPLHPLHKITKPIEPTSKYAPSIQPSTFTSKYAPTPLSNLPPPLLLSDPNPTHDDDENPPHERNSSHPDPRNMKHERSLHRRTKPSYSHIPPSQSPVPSDPILPLSQHPRPNSPSFPFLSFLPSLPFPRPRPRLPLLPSTMNIESNRIESNPIRSELNPNTDPTREYTLHPAPFAKNQCGFGWI